MKRRKFITLVGLGSAAVALPSFTFNSDAFLKNAISAILYRELDYLKLDKEGVIKFTEDFTKKINSYSFGRSKKMRARIGSEYLFPGSVEKEQSSNLITTTFLLASDFFTSQMNESKTIKYIGLYDAYNRPCANPFSHLYYTKS